MAANLSFGMEFETVVRRRRMVRRFVNKPIASEDLDTILDHATRAPSAGFSQGWGFVVLEGEDRRLFWETTRPIDPWDPSPGSLHAAGAVILPLSHKQAYLDRYSLPDKEKFGMGDETRWPVPYWDIDVAFACQNMLLTAVDLGLGALFFGIFTGERDLLEALGVPDGFRPIGAIAVGHPLPGERSKPSLTTGRRPQDQVVHRGRWGQGPLVG
jgi:nitroreductase